MTKKFTPVFLINGFPSFILLILSSTIFFTSCKTFQPAYYFKGIKKDTLINGFINSDLELRIQKNDVLSISISSLSNTEDALFNTSSGTGSKTGFEVTPEGNIYLHKLGRISVAGLTRKELKAKLERDLLPYLKDPIVTVNFVNHRITVLGESGSQVMDMPEEKISLLEVMAKSGAGTPNAQLNKVMVIRESANSKQVKHLNLEDPSIFTSPWYYLQPNDIVVVKPNEERIITEQKRSSNQLLYATVLSGISFVFLIVDRIFR
ncbi:MAG: polysaccharide biosynthesis/export family protein [Ferruginibacter sp.]